MGARFQYVGIQHALIEDHAGFLRDVLDRHLVDFVIFHIHALETEPLDGFRLIEDKSIRQSLLLAVRLFHA
jgi:hypothetical protein